MLTVFVSGLEFYGYHGVSAEERAVGHRYVVDLKMMLEGAANVTDDIAETVDYADAAALALEIGVGEPCRTLEFLAKKIGDTLVAGFPLIESVKVTLAKRLPPAPIIAHSAGVVVTVYRQPV